MHPKELNINDFSYQLPENKVALHPLQKRDFSKLLIYEKAIIREDVFYNISSYLPINSLLLFNNTKVIKARLRFQNSSGVSIEIFCLEPYDAQDGYSNCMTRKERIIWKSMIGGAAKLKEEVLEKIIFIDDNEIILRARVIEKLPESFLVEFSWQPSEYCFADLIQEAGDIPLPPYIKRETEESDLERYQTIYAKDEGSVAAPTAGLHFTPEIFESLKAKQIDQDFVTLHVGAGTFKPVKAGNIAGHTMHAEWISVTIETLENLYSNLQKPCIAVGTTSARTIESLYWMGVKVLLNPELTILDLGQWETYEEPLHNHSYPAVNALQALLDWLKKNGMTKLFALTKILIAPGYRFKIINGIITNFHQPGSTLLLLVAAAIGEEWKNIYTYALRNDFRFLSYGDGSLIFIDDSK